MSSYDRDAVREICLAYGSPTPGEGLVGTVEPDREIGSGGAWR
jgi:hypothetical protein